MWMCLCLLLHLLSLSVATSSQQSRMALLITGQALRLEEESLASMLRNVVRPQTYAGVSVDIFAIMSAGRDQKADPSLYTLTTQTEFPMFLSSKRAFLERSIESMQLSATLVMWTALPERTADERWQELTGQALPNVTFEDPFLNHKRQLNVKWMANMRDGWQQIMQYSKQNQVVYTSYARSRTDNFFYSPIPALPSLPPDCITVPQCRSWRGINDKFAIVTNYDIAEAYFNTISLNQQRLQTGPVDLALGGYRNPEALLLLSVQQVTECVHRIPIAMCHLARGPTADSPTVATTNCLRSFWECVEGDALMEACSRRCRARNRNLLYEMREDDLCDQMLWSADIH